MIRTAWELINIAHSDDYITLITNARKHSGHVMYNHNGAAITSTLMRK